MGVIESCKPRREVLVGELEDAIFAADFGDLIAEESETPSVYADPKTFFENTHPARDLRTIVGSVFRRLASPEEAGATIRLSTGYGGGKTHTLIALWHLANHIDDSSLGTELLPASGRPESVTTVAVDGSKAGSPVFLRHGGVTVKSLQGEIAYQFGGAKAVRSLGKADHPEAQPDEQLIASLLPDGPVLMLLDELVIYTAGLSDRGQANVLAFVNKLAAIASRRRQTVLVVTDPGPQAAYAQQSAQLRQAIQQTAMKLDDLLGRRSTDFDPIGAESAQVIGRRLFETVERRAGEAAAQTYRALYERVAEDHPNLIPASALSPEYAKRIVESYPFHPRLLDTARDRLGALEDFHKSRGVLRLFARILREVWNAGDDVDLITAGEIDFSSPSIRGDLLQRLNRESFDAAVSADIEKHARELDGAPRGVHRRAAMALLFESLPMQPSSGLTEDELTLAVLRPDEAGPEPAEALDRLVGVCWHTYPMPSGRGWQFRYEPNVIKQVEERRTQVPVEDAEARVLAEAQQYFHGGGFHVRAWPENAKQVPESAELQLVLCRDQETANSVCNYVDDTDPNAPVPRRFQNAILAITARPAALRNAVSRAQGLMAVEQIERDYRRGEEGKKIREQLQRLKPEIDRQFRIQTRRAFDQVALAGNHVYRIDETYQGPDEDVLRQPRGQTVLRRYLDDKELIYQSTDAIDSTRFVRDALPGTVSHPEMRDVYTGKAILERLLGAPGLRLFPDQEVVRQTITRAVRDGKVVVRLGDGRAFDAKGSVEGPDGGRRRTDSQLGQFALSDDVLVAPADTETAAGWVKEDEKGKPPKPPPPPPPPGEVTATSWDQAVDLAGERLLLELRVTARTPAAAALPALTQLLGADSVSLSVAAGGKLKAGGTMYFNAEGVKLTHPARPLDTAQLVANSLEDGQSYEVALILGFGAGRGDMAGALKDLGESVPEDVLIQARFGAPAASPA